MMAAPIHVSGTAFALRTFRQIYCATRRTMLAISYNGDLPDGADFDLFVATADDIRLVSRARRLDLV